MVPVQVQRRLPRTLLSRCLQPGRAEHNCPSGLAAPCNCSELEIKRENNQKPNQIQQYTVLLKLQQTCRKGWINSNLDVCKTKPKLALYWSKYLPTIAVKGKKRKYTQGYVLLYYPHSVQGLLTHEVGLNGAVKYWSLSVLSSLLGLLPCLRLSQGSC